MNWLVIMWKQVNSIEFGAIPTEKRMKYNEIKWKTIKIHLISMKSAWNSLKTMCFNWNSSVCVRLYAVHPILWTVPLHRTFTERKNRMVEHSNAHARENRYSELKIDFVGVTASFFQKWRLINRFSRIPCPTYTENIHDAMEHRRMTDYLIFIIIFVIIYT